MHDSRSGEGTPPLHYTMRTQQRHSPAASSSYAHMHPYGARPTKVSKSTSSPATSPRAPYSVGQNYPPMLSPNKQPEGSGKRAPSPNYFGLVVEPNHNNDPQESSGPASHNWSPSSSVKSFGAALPKQMTLDPNPDFEAFRRAADSNRGKSLSIPSANWGPPTSNPAPVRPRPPPRWHTHASDTGSDVSFQKSVIAAKGQLAGKSDPDRDSLHDSAYVSSDSKRNSESSLLPGQITSMMPLASPMPMETPMPRNSLTPADPHDPRLSLNMPKRHSPAAQSSTGNRAATLPPKLDPNAPPMISGSQLKELVDCGDQNKLLVLDIRSSQSFARSRVKGSLNLCIPTTLLKRATFNIQKLQQTFKGSWDSEQFSKWRDMEWIVVYDAHASDQRDAVTAQNMIKKFTNEGFPGRTAILRGGFTMLQTSHPELIDSSSTGQASAQSSSASNAGGVLAPVIGGVSLPKMDDNNQNPFFSSIRQNMDLADGVGQFPVARPEDLQSPLLPSWLRETASEQDKGKKVSDKFLSIELDEQSRMRTAYAAFNPNTVQKTKFQLCGVEKGTKNRYKDILPFDHTRVRLREKVSGGTCDYVNASHLSASRTNKRYIATQGPLPATFDDFWSMIWEQDVRVIVMLGAESEGGQLKCHPYWKGREFGPIRLRPLSEKKASLDIDKHRSDSHSTPSSATHEFGRRRAHTTTTFQSPTSGPQGQASGHSDSPYVTIRKFALSHAAHPFAPMREITHLHFSSWPDFGTPAQPSHLLALVELANVMQRAALPVETAAIVGSRVPTIDSIPVTWYDEPEQASHARPMLVHCSAGCGRTGTFCTVDSVIDMLKRRRQAEVAASRPQDDEGDVTMDELDEAISPMTSKTPNAKGFFDRGTAANNFDTWDGAGIDTTWLQDDNVDLIQKTVEDFREQRLSTVQSLRQYVLCYETILEWMNRMQDRASSSIGGRARSGSLQARR